MEIQDKFKSLIENLWEQPFELFLKGGPYRIATSPLICRANKWSDFYMIGTSVMKELIC